MKSIVNNAIIIFSLFTCFISVYAENNKSTCLIICFKNNIDFSKVPSKDSIFYSKVSAGFDNFSEDLSSKIIPASIIKNITQDSIYPQCDAYNITNPVDWFAKGDTNSKTNYAGYYFIIGSTNSLNQLLYASAKIFYVYQTHPLKYFELFEIKTKYYNSKKERPGAKEQIISELLTQLKSGFDDDINVVFRQVNIDLNKNEYTFLKNAVPEYLKSRLIISNKIKVYKDTIITHTPGVTKKPQYIIDGYVFDDRDRIHIIANCSDNEEDRIILSKQISFNIENPDSLEIKLLEIGDDFRNAILNLYNSKVYKRKSGFAIVANPPFFTNPENADYKGMTEIVRKIIFSFITSSRTDMPLLNKYEFISNPNYYKLINKYICERTEPSVITNDLNAKELIILQTFGNPVKFDLTMQIYNPAKTNELEQFKFIHDISQGSLLNTIDSAYITMRNKLLETHFNLTKNKNSDTSKMIIKFKGPSEFYKLVPNNLGVRLLGLHSLFIKNSGNLFLGNYLRPALEIGGYYSFSIWNIPISFDVSFMYDFGHFRDYSYYGDTTNHSGTVYGRNINFVFKFYLPFYGRIKNCIRIYGGTGVSLINIQRVSTRETAGMLEPGIIYEVGGEYNLTNNFYFELNIRFLTSWAKFTTLDEYSDNRSYGYYDNFFLGGGIGFEF